MLLSILQGYLLTESKETVKVILQELEDLSEKQQNAE
jgi:hypothetical protein